MVMLFVGMYYAVENDLFSKHTMLHKNIYIDQWCFVKQAQPSTPKEQHATLSISPLLIQLFAMEPRHF